MARRHPFQTLTFKLMAMLMLSASLSVGLYFLCHYVGRDIVDYVFLSPAQIESRITADIESFRSFVETNNISSTDALAVGQWNQQHSDVRLTITGRDTIMTSDGYGAELILMDSGFSLRLGMDTGYEFPVNFADGAYTVGVYNYAENRFYGIVDIGSVIISALFFLIAMLLYQRHVMLSILRLSRQVRQVSRGDLQMHIQAPTRDEIGQLAGDVEVMRLSIIDQLRQEEKAWQANSQLITAISHDIRTPLTALMGYLDVLSNSDLPPETQQSYLSVCRRNALRLKDLTDELFGFFLVFGQRNPEQHPEDFDAATLMEQILLESQDMLLQHGFDIRINLAENVPGILRVDLGHLRRVFENLFSNVRKYADPKKPVIVTEAVESDLLTVSIVNSIPASSSRAESSRIGLKTCETLLRSMGGTFRQQHTDGSFTAEVTLPLHAGACPSEI